MPIYIWVDDCNDPGGEGPFPQTLLDGRSRIEALKHLGITDPRNAPYRSSEGKRAVRYLRASENPGINPETFVISLNLHRLHLGGGQRRELIKVLIQVYPQTSNRKIGKMAGASHSTVAAFARLSYRRRQLRSIIRLRSALGEHQQFGKFEQGLGMCNGRRAFFLLPAIYCSKWTSRFPPNIKALLRS
jgi:hypothetical protein